MVTQTTIARDLAEARRRGIDYILPSSAPTAASVSPESEGLGPYYKALWALAAGGEVEAGEPARHLGCPKRARGGWRLLRPAARQ